MLSRSCQIYACVVGMVSDVVSLGVICCQMKYVLTTNKFWSE